MNRIQPSTTLPLLLAALLVASSVFSACSPASEESGTAAGVAEDAEHAGNSEEDEQHRELAKLTAAELEEFGIEIELAAPGTLPIELTLPGEVTPNLDRYAHIVPRVTGIVRSVHASIGDELRAGALMAVLESRELADAQADYLAVTERLALAESNAAREARLFERSISSEQEYLEAKQALAEARISLRSTEQKLHALGFSKEYLDGLPERPESTLIRYSLTAPFAGTVLEKHIVLGEALEANTEAFTLADLSSVWIDLSVYQKDLGLVRAGQELRITARPGGARASGAISYVRPIVDEETRTALARMVLANSDGQWKPGMFIDGTIEVDQVNVSIMVPRTALHSMEDDTVVFVETEEGFEPRPVLTGRSNRTHIEIVEGLAVGERFAATGGFVIKAELGKSELGEGHGH